MGLFLVYIMKSALCLAAFYLFYRLLLSRETFHRFNRLALLGVLVLSGVLPLVEVSIGRPSGAGQSLLSLEQWLLASAAAPVAEAVPASRAEVPWAQALLLAYVAGAVFFVLRGGYSLLRLLALLRSARREDVAAYVPGCTGVCLLVHDRDIAPFSWMRCVVISRKDLQEDGRAILAHELAHIRRGHSWDLLLADLCIFLQWFNPAAWLLKQELQSVHEYEADEAVLASGVNAKEYQLLLIKKAVGTRLYSLANSFNHSKLKKRITMMTKRKSNPWARAKYLYVLPLAAVAVVAFARPEVSGVTNEIAAAKVSDLSAIVKGNVPESVASQPDSLVTSRLKGKLNLVYVVDGKKALETDVASLSPDSIAYIRVRKDAAILEKYGLRDDVAVIMVETKQHAGTDKPKVLYVIDGNKVGEDILSTLPADDIASMQILKDEASLVKYGATEGGSVIVINLKKSEAEDGKQAVDGIVVDEAGEPVIGAIVCEADSKNGVVTGSDGKFSLRVSPGANVEAMYVGLQTVRAKAESGMKIVMKAE